MKLVMTLIGREVAETIGEQVGLQCAAGVDLVIASADGATADRLRAHEHVHLVDEPGASLTQLARLAATDFGADWVFSSEAGEFWWPRGGTLKDVLAAVPTRFGVVRALVRQRAAQRSRPAYKPLHRAHPEVTIGPDGHEAFGDGLLPLRGWYPVDILELSDTRLRDPLKALRAGAPVEFAAPDVDEAYVSELAALQALDEAEQAQRRVEQLEGRLSALETSLPARLRSRLRRR